MNCNDLNNPLFLDKCFPVFTLEIIPFRYILPFSYSLQIKPSMGIARAEHMHFYSNLIHGAQAIYVCFSL